MSPSLTISTIAALDEGKKGFATMGVEECMVIVVVVRVFEGIIIFLSRHVDIAT